MRILGIDAGFAAMGAVVAEGDRIVYAGTCRTERNAHRRRGVRVADDDVERAQRLAQFLHEVITGWAPVGAVVELPGGGAQSARANRAMGMASGIVAAVLQLNGLPAEWVTPQAVKRAAAGRKGASKLEVAAAVSQRFVWACDVPGTLAEQEHIFDAAGALLAARQGTLLRALERMAR